MAVGWPLASRSMVVVLPSPSMTADQAAAAVVGELVKDRAGQAVQCAQVASGKIKNVELLAVIRWDERLSERRPAGGGATRRMRLIVT